MFKDIAVSLFSVSEDEPALAAAETLASVSDADLTAVLLELEPEPIYTIEGVMVTAMWTEVLAQAREGFAKERALLDARTKRSERAIAVRELVVASGLAAGVAAVHARHADLTVMMRPGGDNWRIAVFEGVLFGSGRPVLLVPPSWKGPELGRNVVVAWNGKREAARALADAAPLLDKADLVTIMTVDAQPSVDGVGPAPGADIAAHLARRGLRVEVRNLDGLGRDSSDILMEGAARIGADLIVMGGYGRARLREWIFGGVTRAVIENAQVPVFMSH
ncbi:MAG: universal stress protein [Hyphomonadaceae bacterium]|nr:universal stress protein [Hyphomonadaceae bacterium]